jgi:RNA polymerase-binding transcription factor DksA
MTMTISTTTMRQTDTIAERLPEYRALLEEQWRRQVADIVALSYDALAPAAERDSVSHVEDLHVNAQVVAAARQQLAETEAALARVDAGTYGRCAGCNTSISAERLEVLPAARYCVTCQAGQSRRVT